MNKYMNFAIKSLFLAAFSLFAFFFAGGEGTALVVLFGEFIILTAVGLVCVFLAVREECARDYG
jgi:hypothetical protein